jgi:hypothetical protein
MCDERSRKSGKVEDNERNYDNDKMSYLSAVSASMGASG